MAPAMTTGSMFRGFRRGPGVKWLPALTLGASLAAACAGQAVRVAAQPAPGVDRQSADDNAAVHYLTLALVIDKDALIPPASLFDGAYTDDWRQLDAFRRSFPADSQLIDEAVRGSQLRRCNFGIHYDEGPRALLPHLGHLRATARLIALDARALLEEGKPAQAVERLAVGYRMAEHVSQDQLLISALVAASMFAITDEMTDYFNSRGAIDEQGRAALRSALARFDHADPFRVRASLETERAIMIRWLRTQADSSQGRAAIAQTLQLDAKAGDAADALRQATASSVHLDSYIQLLQRGYQQALSHWDEQDEAALSAVEAQVERGVFGPLAQMLMPTLSRTRDSDQRAQQLLHDRLALLGAPTPELERP